MELDRRCPNRARRWEGDGVSESAKDLKALLEQRQRDQARIERLGERLRLAEAKIALGLERMRELLNRDLNTGQLWWQDREAIVGVVLALEVGEGTKPVECTARPYECTDGPYGRTHGADCPLSTTTGQVTP